MKKTTMYKSIVLTIIILLFVISLSMIATSKDANKHDTKTIFLRSGNVVPDESTAAEAKEQLSKSALTAAKATKSDAETTQQPSHIVLQLSYLPNDDQKNELSDNGIRLLDYIPDYAWVASVDNTAVLDNYDTITFYSELDSANKLSPVIAQMLSGEEYIRSSDEYSVSFFRDVAEETIIDTITKYTDEFVQPLAGKYWIITLEDNQLDDFVEEDILELIDLANLEKIVLNDGARGMVGSDFMNGSTYNLNGSGVVVAEWDEGHANHTDFEDRLTYGDGDSISVSSHSTHVAGTVLGSGNYSEKQSGSHLQWRGIAPNASLITYDWPDNVADIDNETNHSVSTHNAVISQNSWGWDINATGCGRLGNYHSYSAEYDKLIIGNSSVIDKRLTVVFSAGNDRDDSQCYTPTYAYKTISSPGGVSKNTITVGAINSDDSTMTTYSSWGPTNDSRIKPDVVAPGDETGGDGGIKSTVNTNEYSAKFGTSMAAPVVSGIAALIYEQWKINNNDVDPLPSTVKAVLIHTATEVNGTKGPDFATGYGLVNLTSAIDLLLLDNKSTNTTIMNDTFTSAGDNYTVLLTLTNVTKLKITLVWDDYPGAPSASKTLVNDLDLIVKDPTGARYFPYTLNGSSPADLAVTTYIDSVNTVEQVDVNLSNLTAGSGEWNITVNATVLAISPQTFTLIVENSTFEMAYIAPNPVDGYLTNDSFVYINFSSTVALSNVSLEWNGTNETMDGTPGTSKVWSVFKNISGFGNFTYKIYANNSENYWGILAQRTVEVNNTPPTVLTYSPTDLTPTQAEPNNQSFNITFNDKNNDTLNLSWYANASLVSWNQENNSFNITTGDYAQGTHNITAIVTDGMLTSRVTWIYTATSFIAKVAAVVPANTTQNTTNTSIKLGFTVTANTSAVPNCTLNLTKVLNQTITSIDTTGATNYFNLVNMTEDIHYWGVFCHDELDNINHSGIFNLTVDLNSPYVNSNGTSNTSFEAGTTIQVWANFTDAVAGLDTAKLMVNGIENMTNSSIKNSSTNIANFSYTSSVAEGQSSINFSIWINDTAGNLNLSSNITVSIRNLTPAYMSLYAPTNNTQNNTNTSIKFAFNIEANATAINNCTLNLTNVDNQTKTTIVSGINYFDAVNMTEELFYWNVICNDTNTHANTTIIFNLTVDLNSPVLNESSTTNNTFDIYTPIQVWANWTDSVSGLHTAVLLRNGVPNMTNTSIINSSTNMINFTYNSSSTDAAQFINLSIQINDTAGNINRTSNFSVFVRETRPPAIVTLVPTNSTKNNTNNSIKFSFQISANYSAVNNCTLNLSSKDNQTVTSIDSSATNSFGHVNLSDGFHGWNVICNDSSSNFNTTEVSNITVDINSPKILSINMNKPAYFNSTQSVLVTVEANDTGTGVSNITVDGTLLTVSVDNNTINLSVYNGTFTFGSSASEGVNNITIIATDVGEKTNTSTTTQYYIDTTYPVMTVHSPNTTTNITNTDGNISLSWTVVERNLSNTTVTIDDDRVVSDTTVSNGTVNLAVNVSVGPHKFVFSATDWANLTVTEEINVTLISNVNVSERIAAIINASPQGYISNVSVINSSNGTLLTGELLLNTSIGIEIKVNNSVIDNNVNITITVPSFHGLNANWNQTVFMINTLVNSTDAINIRSNIGANLSVMALIQNFTSFLGDEKYSSARIEFNQSLNDRIPIYFSASSYVGSNLIKLPICDSNTTPASVTTVSQACYTAWTNNVTLHLPHFDGGGLANDTVAPTINILEPSNTSIASNTYTPLRFEALELNPNGTFCIFNLTNSTDAVMNLRITNASVNWTSVTGTNYTYLTNMTDLTNTQYNITIYCADLNNRTTILFHHNFTVNDITGPVIEDLTVDTDSITTEGATVSWTTNETSNSSFRTGVGTYANSSTYTTSHSIIITGGLSASTAYGVNVTSCDYYGNCGNGTVNFTTIAEASDSSGGSSSSGGGGGGGGTADSGSLTAMIQQRKAWYWSVVDPGLQMSVTIKEENFSVRQASFTTARKASGVTFSISRLKGLPDAVNELEGDIYQYLYFSTKNIDNDAISSADVSFSIPKTWASEKNIDKDKIKLYRYVEPSWTILDTKFDKQDTEYLYYSAYPPGFSYFAVGGKAETVSKIPKIEESDLVGSAVTVPVSAKEDKQKEIQEEPTVAVSEEEKEKSNALKYIIYLVIAILVALLVWYITKKIKYKNQH